MADEREVDPGLGARPESDPLARAVAKARTLSALLGTDERVKLGRYHLLERAGAGGMGVVYAAWDPELDRRVAIKIMHFAAGAKRERALVEGQALAKLSHPNVVAVHDVGVFEEQLYLVMEWIRGTSLRAYVGGRATKEIVAAYRAAGEGLRAAHAAGLVHRDFKPDNVMVADDGRVRVLDFGLALAERDAPAAAAGTPRYMPPEQERGDALTAAADQYAFCVSLRESLGDAPPAWLTAIVDRGASHDPAARFASMEELLRALAHDPATVWQRRAFVGGAIAMTGIAFAIGLSRGGDETEHCTGAPDELARSWSPAHHDRVVAHLRELGKYGSAEADRIAAQLGAYGKQWSIAHRAACIAHERGDIAPNIYERGLGCLARARIALETVGAVLGRVTVERLPDAIVASRDLPNIDRCVEDTAASPVAPPEPAIAREVDAAFADLARANVLVLAGDPTATDIARPVAAAADRLRYAPLRARAQLVLGSALALDRKTPEAIAAYEAASTAALDGGDDATFVEAYARELFLSARVPKDKLPADATEIAASLRYVARIAERTPLGAFARTLLYNNAGTTRLAAGDTAGAHAWFDRAYGVPHPGKRPIELSAVLGNLASTTSDPAERARLFREQRDHLEAELGPTHIVTLLERVRSVQFVDDPAAALRELDVLCTELVSWHPHRADKIDPCAYELASLARSAGDPRERAALAMISKVGDPRNQLAQIALQLLDGDAAGAAVAAAAIADAQAKLVPWWSRFWAVEAWLLEARAQLALGDRTRAIEAAKRARAMLDEPGFDRTLPYVRRRVVAADALTGDSR
jgi:hypothetical protein